MKLRTLAMTTMALAITMASVGCGDDDDEMLDAGGGDSAGSAAGTGGASAGAGGTSAGAGGTSAGAGGTSATAGSGGSGLPDIECDTSIPTTATCGGLECPASTSPTAAFTCTVPCCVEDQCGTRSASTLLTTECAVPAEADSSCPAFEGEAMGMPVNLPGCCMPSGVCGVISSITNNCITESMFIDLPADPPACGSSATGDAGIDDAGIDDAG